MSEQLETGGTLRVWASNSDTAYVCLEGVSYSDTKPTSGRFSPPETN